jgi:di/tricarboxylate transporter
MEILAVLLLVVSAIILFATEALRVDVVAILILVALALSGLIAPEEALSGFSNPATATVAAMFVLSAGLRHTGLVDAFADGVDALLGRSAILVTLGLMIAVGLVSAFINNTAAVAVLIPIVIGLCRRHAWSPSRFLMPLSFMGQIGGVCTLVGTSTNILVSDIARRSGMEPFGMFEFSALGLCFAGVGFVYLALVPSLLLRRNGDAPPQPLAARYELGQYLTEIEVGPDSELVGQRLADTQIGERLGLEVLEVIRGGRPVWIPAPEQGLEAGDVLVARAPISNLLDAQQAMGLRFKRNIEMSESRLQGSGVVLVEALVAPDSRLVGKTLQEAQFRRRYRCQAIAIRHHDRLEAGTIGKVRLAVGDVLLLQGYRRDIEALAAGLAVLTLEEIAAPEVPWLNKGLAVGAISGAVAFATLGVAPILVTAMAAAAFLVIARVLTIEQAYQAIDWKVIFLLAGVIPLGIALESNGAAGLLSRGVMF